VLVQLNTRLRLRRVHRSRLWVKYSRSQEENAAKVVCATSHEIVLALLRLFYGGAGDRPQYRPIGRDVSNSGREVGVNQGVQCGGRLAV